MDTQVVTNVTEFKTADLKLKGFKVYRIETSVHPIPRYSRRDFYKVCLLTGYRRQSGNPVREWKGGRTLVLSQ